MPRNAAIPSARMRRYQIPADTQLEMYGRPLGLFGGEKVENPLEKFIDDFNAALDSEAKSIGEEPGTWRLENETDEGREEIQRLYNSLSGLFRDRYRIVDGKIREVVFHNGKWWYANADKPKLNGKPTVETLDGHEVKPVKLPIMEGIGRAEKRTLDNLRTFDMPEGVNVEQSESNKGGRQRFDFSDIDALAVTEE